VVWCGGGGVVISDQKQYRLLVISWLDWRGAPPFPDFVSNRLKNFPSPNRGSLDNTAKWFHREGEGCYYTV
jgi:hypothetical protein